MRRTALLLAPVFALALVAGCDQVTNTNGSGSGATAGQGGGGSGPCIVGSWTADAKNLLTQTLGQDGSLPSGATADGTLGFTFTSTDFTYTMDVSLNIMGQSSSSQGEVTGTYRADGGQVLLKPTKGSSTEDGKTTQMSTDDLSESTMNFECSSSTLTLTPENGSTSDPDLSLGNNAIAFTRK